MKVPILLLFLVTLVLCGCQSTDLAPVRSGSLRFEDDEQRLWTGAQKEQRVLDRSGLVYEDPALEAYLTGVARNLQPREVVDLIPFSVRVIRDRHLNAFAFPNGRIYLHTGILARMDNEAQLAALLAHEMTHCTHRHAVKNLRDIKNKTAFLAALQSATVGMGAIGEMAGLLGTLGTVASVTGYSRENEAEADTEGFKLVVRAGYDPKESKKLFEHLRQQVLDEKKKEPFFFGSHPRLQERIDNYEKLIRETGGKGGVTRTEEFLRNIKDVLLVNAFLDLKAGRFETAMKGAEKYLAIAPQDARAYYLAGEIFRQKGGDGEMEKGLAHYERAISLAPGYPEPYRGAGLIYLKRNDRPRAKSMLESYLLRAPNAADRKHIEEYVRECSAKGEP